MGVSDFWREPSIEKKTKDEGAGSPSGPPGEEGGERGWSLEGRGAGVPDRPDQTEGVGPFRNF